MIAYRITNLVTGACYIGITKRTARRRFIDHLWRAANSVGESFLARAIRKYGAASFSCETIASAATEADLVALEILLIKQERTLWSQGGYNLTTGGEGRRGGKQSPEEVRKRVEKLRGHPVSEAARAAVSAAQKGRKRTPEQIAKFIKSRTGIKKTPEQIEKSARFHRGRKRAPETGIRISAANKCRNKPTAVKSHCPHGHPYSGDNLYLTFRGDVERRECRACCIARSKRYNRRT